MLIFKVRIPPPPNVSGFHFAMFQGWIEESDDGSIYVRNRAKAPPLAIAGRHLIMNDELLSELNGWSHYKFQGNQLLLKVFDYPSAPGDTEYLKLSDGIDDESVPRLIAKRFACANIGNLTYFDLSIPTVYPDYLSDSSWIKSGSKDIAGGKLRFSPHALEKHGIIWGGAYIVTDELAPAIEKELPGQYFTTSRILKPTICEPPPGAT